MGSTGVSFSDLPSSSCLCTFPFNIFILGNSDVVDRLCCFIDYGLFLEVFLLLIHFNPAPTSEYTNSSLFFFVFFFF